MYTDLEKKVGGRRLKKIIKIQKKKNQLCALTIYDHFLTISCSQFKVGSAASCISNSLLSVFIYNSSYLQIAGGTAASTLAPNPWSDVLQYTI